MELSLIWWNTSLSPMANPDQSDEETVAAAFVLTAQFTTLLGADIIALGEMSSADVKKLQDIPELAKFSIHDGTQSAGRSHFDTCLLFRNEKFELLSNVNIRIQHGTRSFKLGQRFELAVKGYDRPLYLIVSHWPSRLWCEENHYARSLLGFRLRDTVSEITEKDKLANIILLGDYNDEPFDESLAECLMATRDRELAMRKSHLFYNPFWRHLSRKEVRCVEYESREHPGSYFHRSGDLTRWRTYDQIMFSSSFLGSGDWNLVDSRTVVIDIPEYTRAVLDSQNTFDHLPIMGVIERRSYG